MVGETLNPLQTFGALDVFLVKTDPLGNDEWRQVYGGTGFDDGRSLQQTSDGGFIIGGGLPTLMVMANTICT